MAMENVVRKILPSHFCILSFVYINCLYLHLLTIRDKGLLGCSMTINEPVCGSGSKNFFLNFFF